MPPNYVSLLQELITRLEGQVPWVYSEQCRAMVREFVQVRDSLSSLLRGAPDGENSSVDIFQELHRLACEAERLLTGFCDEQQWLQAVVFTDSFFTDPKWSIFNMLAQELNWCFDILRKRDSTVERLAERNREEIFHLDQKKLITQLQAMRSAAPEHPIAKLVLARLGDADETGGALLCWSTDRLKCGRMKRFLTCLLPRHWNMTPDYTAVDFNVFMITDRVEGVRAEPEGLSHSIVTRNLEWAGVSPVAVKAFLKIPSSTNPRHKDIQREWTNEVRIMAKLNHPNVVRFIGCTSHGDDHGPAILMESEDMSLQQFIKLLQEEEDNSRKSQTPAEGRNPAEPLLDTLVAVDILTQIASGMAYLHGQDVAHLDLKLANLLVSSSRELPRFLVRKRDYFFRVKIADFGSSIHLKGLAAGKIRNPFGNHGSTVYRAPELFRSGGMVCMKAADVCSFAFTCWAILHCEEPKLPNVKTSAGSDYYDALVRNTRLEFHESILPELRELINRCWDTNPDDRPGFSEIYYVLQSCKGSLLGSQLPLVQLQNS